MQSHFMLLVFSLLFISSTTALQDEEDAPVDINNKYVDVHNHPKSGFSCLDKKAGEYYADPTTNCQLYFVCLPNAHLTLTATSFACPNTTRFNQATRVCSPADQVYCRIAERYYENIHGNIDSKDHSPNEYLSNFDTTPWQINKKPSKSLIVPLGPILESDYKPQTERPRTIVPKRDNVPKIEFNQPSLPISFSNANQPNRVPARTRTQTIPKRGNSLQSDFVSVTPTSSSNRFKPVTNSNSRPRLPSYLSPNRNTVNSVPVQTTTTQATTTTSTTTVPPTTVSINDSVSSSKPNTDYIYDYVEYDQPSQPNTPNNPVNTNLPSAQNKPKLPSIPAIPSLDEATPLVNADLSNRNVNSVPTTNSNLGSSLFRSNINNQPSSNIRLSQPSNQRPPQRNTITPTSSLNYFNSNPFAGNPFSSNPFVSNFFSPNTASNLNVIRHKRESIEKLGYQKTNFKKDYFLEQPEEDEFSCHDKLPGIGYADITSKCKMFHICLPLSKGKYKDYQLFCESGTGYNQYTASCEPLDKFDCKKSKDFYLYNKQVNLNGYMKNKYRINKQLADMKN